VTTSVLVPRLVVARHLGLDPDDIDPDRPLASYGLDSLRSMELVAALEDAIGRALPESLCFDHPTLATLTGALGGATTDVAPWRADLDLPDDFVVADGDIARHPRHILLTGATGLAGGYLLRTLIDETHAQVWCLVRATAGNGLARIRSNLERYGLWHERLAKRIEVVRGDLAAPQLGLSDAEYLGVATITEAVLHAGADVDWVQPYAALRHVNVLGTLEVLRLAGTARPKPTQFVSSLSVCHVPGGPPLIDPATDCVPYIDRLPLGYAQTKCVAEALCRSASRRGLPMRVIRPTLIAGDSRSGVSNADDLIGRLVRGCIDMGTAPDLDWSFDAVPADELARTIVRAPWPHAGALEGVHLMSRRPRRWQECVLWINLLGYRCRLVPFSEWRDQLAWVGRSPAHPLAPLRAFFAATAGDDAPAELCQATRHSAAAAGGAGSEGTSWSEPIGMDAPMLARQIDGYVTTGALRTTVRPQVSRKTRPAIWRQSDRLAAILGERLGGDLTVRSIEAVDTDPTLGIVSDLSSWRRGRETGVFRHRITIEREGGPTTLNVVVKVRAHDDDVLEAARTLASICDRALGTAVGHFEDAIGLRGAGHREVALYERAPAAIRHLMPACYGTWPQTEDAGSGLLIEDVHDSARLDAVDPSDWTDADIEVAFEGLARIHAVGLDQEASLPLSPLRSSADVRGMAPLWEALARHAGPAFARAAGPALPTRHRALVDEIDDWTPALDASPTTVIHHDFNPRNAAVRRGPTPTLVVYDWELATIGLPQRDLAEFLCFVLPPDVDAERIARLTERYRRLLERASGRPWPQDAWWEGFRSAMALLLVDRLAFYAMVARVRPQSFLDPVLRTWQQIDAAVRAPAILRDLA